MSGPTISSYQYTAKFSREFRKLSPEIRAAAEQALKDLLRSPLPKVRRLHRLNGYDPAIWVIDVLPNKSWQITFTMEGTTATLRRIAVHREIDRAP